MKVEEMIELEKLSFVNHLWILRSLAKSLVKSGVFTLSQSPAATQLPQLCPTLCHPIYHSLPDSSVPWDFPGKNIGVGCHALLQGIFPTKGIEPRSTTEPLFRKPPPKYLLITKRNFTVEKYGQLHLNQMIEDNIKNGVTQNIYHLVRCKKKKRKKKQLA